MIVFEPHGTVKPVAVDASIAVAPQRTRDHQKVHQVEACGVAIRPLKNMCRRMGVLSFAALRHPAIKMDGKRTDRLGEDAHAGPDCRQRQRAFRRDDRTTRLIGHHVGCQCLIHGILELRREKAPCRASYVETENPHRIRSSEANIKYGWQDAARQCPYRIRRSRIITNGSFSVEASILWGLRRHNSSSLSRTTR